MKELKHFILVGAPASGKGTQGRFWLIPSASTP